MVIDHCYLMVKMGHQRLMTVVGGGDGDGELINGLGYCG